VKSLLIALALMVSGLTLGVLPSEADARRLGGGRTAGMQRQLPPKQPEVAPRQNAAPTTPPPATAAAAPAARRSWLGPVAGLAAGLGLAALFSHLGLGAELANFVTLLLLAVVAFVVVRWLMRRLGGGAATSRAGSTGLRYAGAGAPHVEPRGLRRDANEPTVLPRQAVAGAAAGSAPDGAGGGADTPAGVASALPAGFDAAEFERIAKMIFIRLQAANDAGEIEDLRRFTTPELFAALRLDLQERGAAPQKTDVVQLDAEVLDTAQEDGRWIASVRFHGLIREEAGGTAAPFDELWHLVKPVDGSRDWAIAGITPQQG
jgi:predicted lipid-binding transport protein (Tim44 family)